MSTVDEAREAGRAFAEHTGPVTDPAVVARVAALMHAATCTTPFATNGRPRRAAAVKTDPGGLISRVCQSE
jgi:hypothetical protein